MVTGDAEETATAIARQVGIVDDKTMDLIMKATDFDAMSNEYIDTLPRLPLVLFRCSPHSKVNLIEAFHRRKKLCAMSGDGVNDAASIVKVHRDHLIDSIFEKQNCQNIPLQYFNLYPLRTHLG